MLFKFLLSLLSSEVMNKSSVSHLSRLSLNALELFRKLLYWSTLVFCLCVFLVPSHSPVIRFFSPTSALILLGVEFSLVSLLELLPKFEIFGVFSFRIFIWKSLQLDFYRLLVKLDVICFYNLLVYALSWNFEDCSSFGLLAISWIVLPSRRLVDVDYPILCFNMGTYRIWIVVHYEQRVVISRNYIVLAHYVVVIACAYVVT